MQAANLKVDLVIPTNTKYLSLVGAIGEEIAKELDNYQGNREILGYHLNLVLTEATTNVITHSHGDNTSDQVRINIDLQMGNLCIRIYDYGRGFDLESIPNPNFDNPGEGGYGIFLIRSLMDSVEYRKLKGGNLLEMKKRIN